MAVRKSQDNEDEKKPKDLNNKSNNARSRQPDGRRGIYNSIFLEIESGGGISQTPMWSVVH